MRRAYIKSLSTTFHPCSSRPSFFDKAGCTRQFESELSLHSLAPLFPIKGRLHLSSRSSPIVFTTPSVPLVGVRNLREEEETAPPITFNHYAIRLTDHQRNRQSVCAG